MAKRIKQLNNTTYGLTPNEDKFEKFEIEIGDSKQPDFKPQVKLMKWDNEVNFSIRAIDDEVGNFAHTKDEDKIKLIKNKKEYHFYEKDKDNFEFETILYEKPKDNKIEFSVKTKGLRFVRQPALNEVYQGKNVAYCTETECYDKNEKLVVYKSEESVHSYSVHHKTKRDNYSKIGGKNYRAGKAFNINYPYLIDADGWKVRAKDFNLELNKEKTSGILRIVMPQEFLDKAIYPITVDPTFGTTSVFSDSALLGDDSDLSGTLFTSAAGSGNLAVKITAYINKETATYFKGVLYNLNKSLFTNGVTPASATPVGWTWQDTSDFATKPTLGSSTEYWVTIISNGQLWFRSEWDVDFDAIWDFYNNYATPQEVSSANTNNFNYCVYCTYEAPVTDTGFLNMF